MNILARLSFSCLALLLSPLLSAEELLKFHFDNGGNNIDESQPWTGTATVSPALRAFGAGSEGLTASSGLNPLNVTDAWGAYVPSSQYITGSLAQSISVGHYATFTAQATEGQALYLDGGAVRLIPRAGGARANKPESVALLSSVEGFSTDAVISIQPWVDGEAVTFPIAGAIYDNLTEPVEFRLYIYRNDDNATNVSGFSLSQADGDFIALDGRIEPESKLDAPTGLTATAVSSSQVDLVWQDPNTLETAYEVQRSPNGLAGWSTVATLPADSTGYSDSGLAGGTRYFYQVRATSPILQSPWSLIADAVTDGEVPEGAAGLSCTAVNGTKVHLQWLDQTSGENGFRVERSEAGGGWQTLDLLPANSTEYLDRTTVPDQSFTYRVVAFTPTGDTPPSNDSTLTTPLTFTVNFLTFGNSYSHFYEHLPSIAASLGDTVNWVVMRNSIRLHEQLQAEQDEEDGLRTLPPSGTEESDGFSPLETDYGYFVRMKDILNLHEWDVISCQAHSSWANKFSDIQIRVQAVNDYFSQPHHEPSAEIVYYHTTQYRQDEHLFRNLVNTSAHSGTLRGTLPYTQDQHVFDAFVAANQVTETYGYRAIGGGLAQLNLIHDPRWGFDYPDPYFDYFNALAPAEPAEPPMRTLHNGFRWANDGTSNNPKFAWEIDSHPSDALNFLTACLWYEVLFRKDVRASTYRPQNLDEETAIIIRDVAHRTARGELPPLRLADQASRTAYADLLWSVANRLIASSNPDEQEAGYQNLVTLRAYFAEHAQASAAESLLSGVGALESTLALAAKEAAERPVREQIQQAIWDSATVGNPVTIDFTLDGDPDGDGLSARLERALSLNPYANDQARTGSVGVVDADGSSWLTLTHRREKIRADFNLAVQTSTDLVNWTTLTPSSDYLSNITDPDVDGTGFAESVEHRIRRAPGETKRFLRLEVSD